ncbi:MAG: Hpt domain-containing protein [Nitrospirae bacterium]|nr:Hpt domain-containing protein [Nitrospirota bacterium]
MAETAERLGNIEVTILRLKERPEAYGESIHIIFRDAHSVKAAANLLKFRNIEKLSHNLENILHTFREKRVLPDDGTINILLEAIDKMRDLIADIRRSDSKNVTLQIAKLQDLYERLNKQRV